ncbi:hypothetical protein ACJ73_08917, partial [Blastomyces percursus]
GNTKSKLINNGDLDDVHQAPPTSRESLRAVRNARKNHALFPLSSSVLLQVASTRPSTAPRTRPPAAKSARHAPPSQPRSGNCTTCPQTSYSQAASSTAASATSGASSRRAYMRARSAFIHALLDVYSRESVQVQLEHAQDMLRLSRGDNADSGRHAAAGHGSGVL